MLLCENQKKLLLFRIVRTRKYRLTNTFLRRSDRTKDYFLLFLVKLFITPLLSLKAYEVLALVI